MSERSHDAEATRRRILEAAEVVFAEESFSGARVDVIAARAGVNKRMLYHYFGDKRGLYVAVVRRMLEHIFEHMHNTLAAAQAEDPVQALADMLRAYFDTMQGESTYIKLIMHEAVHGWQTMNAIEQERGSESLGHDKMDETLERILPVIERGVAEGKLRADLDPHLSIVLVTMLCRLYVLLRARLEVFWGEPMNTPHRLAWAREQIVELFLHGFVLRK